MRYEYRRLSTWPGERTKARKGSLFKASWDNTIRKLEYELEKLDAKLVVIECEVDEWMIRQDGRLRADARLKGPGVIIAFESKAGPLRYPCDTYLSYTDNVRAIALALEALRAVNRYGVTRHNEQYKGWAKLPPPAGSNGGEKHSPEHAASFLSVFLTRRGINPIYTASILGHWDYADDCLRQAEKLTHPDVGGAAEDFKRVQLWREVFARHHGRP